MTQQIDRSNPLERERWDMDERPSKAPIQLHPEWDTNLRRFLNLLDPAGRGPAILRPLPPSIREDLENRLTYLVFKVAPCDEVVLDQQVTFFYASFPQIANRSSDLDLEFMVRRAVRVLGRFPEWCIDQLFTPTETTARLRNTEYATPPDKFFEIATDLMRPVREEMHHIRLLLNAPLAGTPEAERLQEEGRAERAAVVEKYWDGSLKREFSATETVPKAGNHAETAAETLARLSGLPIEEALAKLGELPSKAPPPPE